VSVTFNTYTGLKAAIPAWMARGSSDPILDPQFDNFLANMERRMYYGYATDDPGNPLRSDPLRIPEMEITVNSTAVTAGSTTLSQPSDFLELISVYNSTLNRPMEIVAQRVIDEYCGQAIGGTKLIAVSGTNFRLWDASPTGGLTLVMHYYQKLTTPTAAASNTILTNYSDVYLYGCLVEATIMTQDAPSAQAYLALYNASVAGLNARTQRITASANPIIRVGGGMHP
jgi:hypothetical protein